MFAPSSFRRSAVSGQLWNWNDCLDPSAIRKAVRPTEVPRVNIGSLLDQILDDLVQTAECCAMERREIGFVYGIDLGTGVE